MAEINKRSSIYCFLDTNILLRSQVFSEVKWPEILKTKEVWLVIAPIVLEELNPRKIRYNNEYSRQFAIKALTVLLTVLHIIDDSTELIKTSPQLLAHATLLVLDKPSIDWEKENLMQALGDDQLLASILGFSRQHSAERILFLSEDIGLRLKAEIRGIQAMETPKELEPLPNPLPPEFWNIARADGQTQLFQKTQSIVSLTLRENVQRALDYLTEDTVDIGLFLLGREFEETIRKYLVTAYAQGKLGNTPGNKSPDRLSLDEMVSCLKNNRIVTDKAALSYLREHRNDRAHHTPTLQERRMMMNNVQILGSLYIDCIKLLDDLFRNL